MLSMGLRGPGFPFGIETHSGNSLSGRQRQRLRGPGFPFGIETKRIVAFPFA